MITILAPKRARLVVAKWRCRGDSSLIDPWCEGRAIFEDEIFPGSLLKSVRRSPGRVCSGPLRAVSRGKAAVRLAFLTVSDGCWLYIYFLFAATPYRLAYPIAIFSVYTASRERTLPWYLHPASDSAISFAHTYRNSSFILFHNLLMTVSVRDEALLYSYFIL